MAHSEEATSSYEGRLQGIQLWVAQPEATRHGPASFAHHADLPRVQLDGGVGTILLGKYEEAKSPARAATPLVGMELDLHQSTLVGLDSSFEYGLIVLDGSLKVGEEILRAGHLGYVSTGHDELLLEVRAPVTVMLLGGTPFDEPVQMWWNFVGRSREEFVSAYASWANDDGRFGTVKSHLARILTTPPAPRVTYDVSQVVER